MAYLGKISAIVSANTAQFVRPLNAAAAETRQFAKDVENNISRGVNGANSSLRGIYTPLQRFQQSLDAAFQDRTLRFRGFQGAVRDVESLRARLSSLRQSEVRVALTTSGVSSIAELERMLFGIQGRDLRIVANVGGLDNLRAMHAEMSAIVSQFGSGEGLNAAAESVRSQMAARQAAAAASAQGGVAVDLGGDDEYRRLGAQLEDLTRRQQSLREMAAAGIDFNVDTSGLDRVSRLINLLQRMTPDRIQVVIDAVGDEQLRNARDLASSLFSVGQRISAPFEAAQKKFAKLPEEIQARFIPAINRSQALVEALRTTLAETGAVGVDCFNTVADEVDSVIERIGYLDDATKKLGEVMTGREFKFAMPGVADVLERAKTSTANAYSVPATALESDPEIGRLVAQVNAKSTEYVNAQASLLEDRTPAREADATRVRGEFDKIVSDLDRRIAPFVVDTTAAKGKAKEFGDILDELREKATFKITGQFTNQQQMAGGLEEIISLMDRVGESDAGRLKPMFDAASAAAATGDVDGFTQAVRDARAEAADSIEVKAKADEFRKASAELDRFIVSAQAAAEFKVAGTFGDQAQMRAGVDRMLGMMDKLDQADAQKLMPAFNDAMVALATDDMNAFAAAYNKVEAETKNAIKAKADTKEIDDAKEKVTSFVLEMKNRALVTIRGEFRGEEQVRAAVSKIIGDLEKLENLSPAGKKAAGTAIRDVLATGFVAMQPGASQAERDAFAKAQADATTVLDGLGGGTKNKSAAKDEFGKAIDDSSRKVDAMATRLVALKGRLDSLPDSILSGFIPAIKSAEAELRRLKSSPTATADEIARAEANLRKLETSEKRASSAGSFQARFGGPGVIGLMDSFNDRELKKYTAQLIFLQSALDDVADHARGPATAAFAILRDAIHDATVAGTLKTPSVKADIEAKSAAAVKAAASATGGSARKLGEDMRRAGDVGRNGFDNMSLALNQAAFAVDDFLSSTGGIEFKLRAVSNNITQMAFVLGGTRGLFIGLAAVIGGQAAVGIYKFITNGRTAEDVTKALNDSLSRQHSLVEGLATAYRSLGESIQRGTMSETGARFGEMRDRMREIREGFFGGGITEQGRFGAIAERRSQVDANATSSRAAQSASKKIADSSDLLERKAYYESLAERAAASERATVAGLRAQPAPTADLVSQAIRRSGAATAAAERSDLGPLRYLPLPFQAREPGAAELAAGRLQQIAGGVGESAESRISALRQAKRVQEQIAGREVFGFRAGSGARAQEAMLAFEQMIRSLEASLQSGMHDSVVNLIKASQSSSEDLRAAQSDLAEAIKRGVPGAVAFQAEVDKTSENIKEANKRIEASFAAAEKGDFERQKTLIDEAKSLVSGAPGVRARAAELRVGVAVGGERAAASLDGIRGNATFAAQAAAIERSMRNEAVALTALGIATQIGTDADRRAAEQAYALAQQASEAAAAMADVARATEDAAGRARRLGDSMVQLSEGGVEQARRSFEGGAGSLEGIGAAERRANADKYRAAMLDEALTGDLQRASQSPQVFSIGKEMERISQRRKMIAADRQAGRPVDEDEVIKLRGQEAAAMRLLNDVIGDLTRATVGLYEAERAGIAARERELDKSRQRDQEQPEFALQRGRVDAAMSGFERQAAESRERFINNPTAENRGLRSASEARASAARAVKQRLQDDLDAAERSFAGRGDIKELQRQIDERAARKAELIQASVASQKPLTPEEDKEISDIDAANAAARAGLESRRLIATRRQRKAIDEFASAEAFDASATRGRDLALTDRERFRKEMQQGVGNDIRNRAKQIELGGGDPTAFINKAIEEQAKTIAPMIEEFRMERENAKLQGPSRAALQVSDVTTTQGQSELNRLLRGDDASKDVNLAELRKQSDYLAELVKYVKDNPLPVI